MAQPGRDHGHEHQEALSSSNSCSPPPFLLLIKNTYLTSFQILLSCPRIYLTIFTFTTLPLSLLFISLSLSTRQTHNHFHRLHYLSSVASTDVESLHVLEEARGDAFSLFFLKATYALPSLFFSLISLITTVAATSSAINPQQQQQQLPKTPPRLELLARSWKRPFWTSMVAYAITFSCVHITHTLMKPLVLMGTRSAMAAFVVVDLVVEVYLMAVISLGLVVSVAEEDQSGLEAIRTGWRLMEGTRGFGWFISGGFLFVSGWIGKQLRMMDGEDLKMMNIFSYCYKGGLVILLALVVLWSYIVGTVYYCQCRRRWQDQQMVHGREADDDDVACPNHN